MIETIIKWFATYLILGAAIMPLVRGMQGQSIKSAEILGWLPIISYDIGCYLREQNELYRKANYEYWEYRGPPRRY